MTNQNANLNIHKSLGILIVNMFEQFH